MKVYIEDDHVFYCTLQLTCVCMKLANCEDNRDVFFNQKSFQQPTIKKLYSVQESKT